MMWLTLILIHNFLTGKSVQTIGFGHHFLQNVTPPLEHAPELIRRSVFDHENSVCHFLVMMTNRTIIEDVTVTITPGNYCDGLGNMTDSMWSLLNLVPMSLLVRSILSFAIPCLQGEGVTLVLADKEAVIDWENSTD